MIAETFVEGQFSVFVLLTIYGKLLFRYRDYPLSSIHSETLGVKVCTHSPDLAHQPHIYLDFVSIINYSYTKKWVCYRTAYA